MEEELSINVQIAGAVRLGNKTCLVQLPNQTEKKEVMENKSKLKAKRGKKVFTQDDLSRKNIDIQKQIRNRTKYEREKGKTTKTA